MMGYGWLGGCCFGIGFMNMWIVGLVFIVITFGLVYFLLKLLSRGGISHKMPTARETLNVRFAKGEISKKEFEQMKKDLEN